jgi:hypothetical protein
VGRRQKMTKQVKKLELRKLTVQDLNIKQVSVLEKEEQNSAKGGKEDTAVGVGVTEHPKYC